MNTVYDQVLHVVFVPRQIGVNMVAIEDGLQHSEQFRRAAVRSTRINGMVPDDDFPMGLTRRECLIEPGDLIIRLIAGKDGVNSGMISNDQIRIEEEEVYSRPVRQRLVAPVVGRRHAPA